MFKMRKEALSLSKLGMHNVVSTQNTQEDIYGGALSYEE